MGLEISKSDYDFFLPLCLSGKNLSKIERVDVVAVRKVHKKMIGRGLWAVNLGVEWESVWR